MSSEEEEDDEYVIHGQLLDPIREDEIVKRKDAEQQFVKDENGRRRFHGAFTGGFSAGFYNTVGSLEGWTPSTFKSSRSSKFTPKQQNAYDFMDEEDKKDLGIDSSSLKIKAEYSNQSSRKRQLPEINTGPIPGKPVLGEILKPTTNTWGVELLKSMGWKPGQGVGPQLTQREKLRTKMELENVGMKFKTNTKYDDDDFEINELLDNFKVSPYEYESVAFKPKTDTFGLGYKCLKTSNVSSKCTEKSYSKLTIEGKSIHGQAFGIGAYENEDYDVYSTDNLSNYDFSLDPKSPNSKNKSKCSKLDSDFIEGFVESNSKHQFSDELSSSVQIPPEWRPQGMFERILGQSVPDFFSQPSSFSEMNVNSRQREIIKTEKPPLSDHYIKKEPRSILPDIMSDRFTRAVLPDDSTNALVPVERTSDPTLVRLKDYAAKKMYGFWTRKTETWTPEKLLCKRFNVPVPKLSINDCSVSDKKKETECSLFSSLEFGSYQPENVESKTSDCVPFAVNEQNNEKQEQINSSEFNKDTAVECQKPCVDFFKDIFLDDSDDEILNVQPSVKSEEKPTNSVNEDICSSEVSSMQKETIKPNVSSTKHFNIFPSKGIFANLNFDELFNTPITDNADKNEISQVNKNHLYGPLLPEKINLKTNTVNPKMFQETFSDDEWVEKVESPKRKTSHSKKHSKHKKSKSKSKSKKKSHKHKK